MNTAIVNIFAGPGAGKSTTAAEAFALFKYEGVNAEYVPEYAKDLVWGDAPALLDYPIALFGEQHQRIARLWSKVPIIVTDSPILLCAYYAERQVPAYHSAEFAALVWREHRRFRPALNVWLDRVKPYEPVGRVHTEAEALEVDRELRLWLTERDGVRELGGLVTVPGTAHAGYEIVRLADLLVKGGTRAETESD